MESGVAGSKVVNSNHLSSVGKVGWGDKDLVVAGCKVGKHSVEGVGLGDMAVIDSVMKAMVVATNPHSPSQVGAHQANSR